MNDTEQLRERIQQANHGGIGADGSTDTDRLVDLVEALLDEARKDAFDELLGAVNAHLNKIENQECGPMLDLMAVAGTLKHDKDNAFRRDRLVSERRAVMLIHSIAATLTPRKEQ